MGRLMAGVAASALALALTTGTAHAIFFDFSNAVTGTLGGSPTQYNSINIGGITVIAKSFNNGLGVNVNLGTQVNTTQLLGANGGLGTDGFGSPQINFCNNNCDNQPGEGILLDFGVEVTITQAQFAAWSSDDDADFKLGIGNTLPTGALIDITGVTVAGTIGTWDTTQTGRYIYFAAIDEGNENNTDSFWLKTITVNAVSQVPEPGTLAVFGASLLALGFVSARRRKS